MKVEAKLPFEFCEVCDFRELEEERIYSFNKLSLSYLYCINSHKCQNAVELYQRNIKNKNDTSL